MSTIIYLFQSTPSDPVTPGAQPVKSIKLEHGGQSRKSTPQKNIDKGRESASVSRQSSQVQVTDQSQPHQKIPVSCYIYYYIKYKKNRSMTNY